MSGKLCKGVWIAVVLSAAGACTADEPHAPPNPPPPGIVLKPGSYPAKWIIPDFDRFDAEFNRGEGMCQKQPPPALKKKPKLISKTPLFGRLVCYALPQNADASPDTPKEAGSWLFALDESKGTGKGYDTLYLDANRNRDLTDDPKFTGMIEPIPAQLRQAYKVAGTTFKSVMRAPTSKLFPGSGDARVASLDVAYIKYGGQQGLQASLRGAWVGEVGSNRGKIAFRLIDETGNGRFNDRWITKGSTPFLNDGDCIWFDWNHTGKFPARTTAYESDVKTQLYGANGIAGRLYVLSPSKTGKTLKIEDYTGPTARVAVTTGKIGKVPLGVQKGSLSGDQGKYSITTDGQLVSVPTGAYDLKTGAVIKYEGATYYFDYIAARSFPASPEIAAVKIDGALRMVIDDSPSPIRVVKGRYTNAMARLMLGDNGLVSVGRSIYDPQLKEPQVVLKDANGTVVGAAKSDNRTSDSKGPGCPLFFEEGKSVPEFIKNLKPGPYTVEVEYDVGAFGGMLTASAPVVIEGPKQ